MHETERDEALDAELRALAPLLDRAGSPPAPPAGLVEQTVLRASAELARSPAIAPGVAASASTLPVGFRRELLRLVAVTLPVLGLVLAWDAFLLMAAPAWLSVWLPPGIAAAVVGAYVLGSLGWIGLTYASLPLVAHRRTLRSPTA
jgi:hypothetical protein